MSANEHIEELLSGFLDGELTAAELCEFEAAMSADAALGLKLQQLQQLGHDLRSVPKRTLGGDFASRVLAAARQEALSSASSDCEFVCKAPKTPNDARRGKLSRVVGVLSALAATLLLAAYVSNWFSAPGEGLAENPPVESPPADNGSTELKEAYVRNDPNIRRRVELQEFAILPIFEIQPSLNAWNTNEVAAVLLKEGILWSKPVSASNEVIKVLNETRSINQGLPKSGEDEQIALVMVKASGRAIDKAMLRIYGSKIDFPHVFMDVAFAMPGKELFENLVGNPALAMPIVDKAGAKVANGGLENLSQFSRARSSKFDKEQGLGGASMVEAENEVAYVLLVIRKPAK